MVVKTVVGIVRWWSNVSILSTSEDHITHDRSKQVLVICCNRCFRKRVLYIGRATGGSGSPQSRGFMRHGAILFKTEGSRSKDAKNKSPFSSENKRNKTTKRVPTGLYHWLGQGDVTHPVHLVMDQHGEFFRIQKNRRNGKGKVYWSHKTNLDMYTVMVSDGVHDYVDAGVTMCPYIHRRGKEPKVISHERTSLETLQKILKHKLRHTYCEDQIDAKSELFNLHLNYETGEVCDNSSPGCFSISITRYHISLWSSAEPRVLQSHLVFADVEALFPDEKFSDKKDKIGEKDFACEVFYA